MFQNTTALKYSEKINVSKHNSVKIFRKYIVSKHNKLLKNSEKNNVSKHNNVKVFQLYNCIFLCTNSNKLRINNQ